MGQEQSDMAAVASTTHHDDNNVDFEIEDWLQDIPQEQNGAIDQDIIMPDQSFSESSSPEIEIDTPVQPRIDSAMTKDHLSVPFEHSSVMQQTLETSANLLQEQANDSQQSTSHITAEDQEMLDLAGVQTVQGQAIHTSDGSAPSQGYTMDGLPEGTDSGPQNMMDVDAADAMESATKQELGDVDTPIVQTTLTGQPGATQESGAPGVCKAETTVALEISKAELLGNDNSAEDDLPEHIDVEEAIRTCSSSPRMDLKRVPDPAKELSKSLRFYTKLQTHIKELQRIDGIAAHRFLVAIIAPGKTFKSVRRETDLFWFKANRFTTIKTVRIQYGISILEDELSFVLGEWLLRDLDTLQDLDFFNDHLIVLRAVKNGDLMQVVKKVTQSVVKVKQPALITNTEPVVIG